MGDVPMFKNVYGTGGQDRNDTHASGPPDAVLTGPIGRPTPVELARGTGVALLDFARSVVNEIGDVATQYTKAKEIVRELSEAEKAKLGRYIKLLGAGEEFQEKGSGYRKAFAQELRELRVHDEFNSYYIREAANETIRKMGPAACPLLLKDLTNSDPEIAKRVNELVGDTISGGLIPINRDTHTAGAVGAGGLFGRLLIGGAGDEFAYGTKQDLRFQVDQVGKFADNPAKTAKRIDEVEQILALCVLGKMHLQSNEMKNLRTELKNLKQIGRLCTALQLDLAYEHAYDGDRPGAKTVLEAVVKRDKKLVNSPEVIGVILTCDLDTKDPKFKEWYAKLGGDLKKVAKGRAERVEQPKLPDPWRP